MTKKMDITSQITRHQIQIQRLAGGNYRKILPILKQLSKDLRLMVLDAVDPEQVKTLQIAEAQTRSLVKSAVSGMTDILEPEFTDFAVYEANFVRSIYAGAVTVELAGITAEQIKAAISNKKMVLTSESGKVSKLSINEAVTAWEKAINKDVKETIVDGTIKKIRGGILVGKTNKQISDDVYHMANNRTRRQAEALVRTSTNHVGSIARQEFYKANESVIQGERYLATLDSRTTLICAGYDGELFDIGKGPQPPVHWNCRSIRVAEVYDKWKIPGLGNERSSVDGPVSAKTTYGSFLKKQDKAFQDDVLGPERAKLFRSGEISIDKFTDNGRTLTLEQLKTKYL